MNTYKVQFTLFTKLWQRKPLPELATFVKGLGFDGIELPVRPGYPVEPDNVDKRLGDAVKIFADQGLKIGSVAAVPTEKTVAACGAAKVPLLRSGVEIPPGQSYLQAIETCQRMWDRLVPTLDQHGVTLGIQNHCGRCLTHAMHLHHAVSKYNPRNVGAVWDPAHNALQGEDVELALDVVWSHLRMVNLKNAYWRRTNGPEAEFATWVPYWTSGRHGLCSWPRVAAEMKRRGYTGDLCFSAEYSDHGSTDRLVAADIEFGRQVFL